MKIINRPYFNIPYHELEVLPCRTNHIELLVPWKLLFKDHGGTNTKKGDEGKYDK